MYILSSLLNPCLHSGETRYNLNNCSYVAEQLHCSLHVKELKVTTTELEGQAGN